MRTYTAWYQATFDRLHHQGLWLRGGELNTLPVEEATRRDFRALFVRLSTYGDTGYSFTHQLLYQLAAGVEGVFPDLAYLPPREDRPLMRQGRVPWLIGTSTKAGPESFHLIGFSNSIVQELVNLPAFLAASGVPLGKRERLARADLPLVILGGANSLYTTVLHGDDPLVDGIYIGEDDQGIRRLLEICRDARRAGQDKRAALDALAGIPGFIEPDRPRATRKSFIWNLDASEALAAGPIAYLPDQLGSAHLQISEGCPCFCSFCAESWDRKPYRERQASVLAEKALAMKARMGLEEIEIYSFNFNMHSGFYRILWDLVPWFRRIGLKSQRFDLLAHDPDMVEFQHAIEKASLTCGLEGISPRLRRYLHKNIESEDLHTSLAAIFRSRARALKVFLIATGLEAEEDYLAFSDLLEHLAEIRRTHGATTRVIFSVTPLVRFPWTPLEFEDAPPAERIGEVVDEVARRVRAAGFEMRASAELPEYWVSQVLVRADDPRIGAALVAASSETGFIYDREVTEEFRAVFERHLRLRGLDPAALFAGFDLETSRAKPWAQVETGVKREFLWEEVERARAYREIDYCLGRAWQRAKCFKCGGCPSKEHVRNIVLARQERDYSLDDFVARVSAARHAERHVSLGLVVGERGRGVPRKLVGIALARALMLAFPELAPGYRGYVGATADRGDDMPVWVGGEECITLAWHEALEPRLAGLAVDPAARARVDAHLGEWGRFLGAASSVWRPSALVARSPFPPTIDRYLQTLRLKATMRRRADGGEHWDLAPPSRKKGIVSTIDVLRDGNENVLELALGPRFDLDDLFRHGFKLPTRAAAARIAATFVAP